MLRYLADEDFDNRILRAFQRTDPIIDWVRVQDIGLSGCEDHLYFRLLPKGGVSCSPAMLPR